MINKEYDDGYCELGHNTVFIDIGDSTEFRCKACGHTIFSKKYTQDFIKEKFKNADV